jgi:abortive infection bacteriophage resistance protein
MRHGGYRTASSIATKWPKDVCDKFGLSHQMLSFWLHSISYIRNICAHHSRLWNRVCTIKPTIPNAQRREFDGAKR